MESKKNTRIAEIEKRLEELRIEKETLLKNASAAEGAYLSSYEIRPAGRHLLTIGEDLIQDHCAAIVELVKNAYDADSPDVTIVFKANPKADRLEIRIEDHGHGMSTEDVINKWLVPSTDYKLKVKRSPLGRKMQGRKGIGRYAASILGDEFELRTVDSSGIETILRIHWKQLAEYEYLDQIQVPIERRHAEKTSGTTLIMYSKLTQNTYWKTDKIRKLKFELKKLLPPKVSSSLDPMFKIILSFDTFPPDKVENGVEIVQPYPILDLYDYRISGEIAADGSGMLAYENNKIKNSAVEYIKFESDTEGCGALSVDIRVYDRDKDAIDQLIYRGLKDEAGNYVTKLQARQLLDSVNGIGVYRNGFRIRPLGDADFDWLKLNEQRVQNPSMKIGSNQVVGYVHVESEEISGLEEKSARDGLKENAAYDALKEITCKVIVELEKRRFLFRRSLEPSKPVKKLEQQLDGLYDYALLKKSISETLGKAGVTTAVVDEIRCMISKEGAKQNRVIEEIKQAVAIYQGQATLGKIVNVILHEGRRPLNYFKNQIPNLQFYGDRFQQDKDAYSLDKVLRITDGITDNAKVFVDLFGRLDPLAAKSREKKKSFYLMNVLNNIIAIFAKEWQNSKIKVSLDCPPDIKHTGWKQDIYTIMVNLLDNSLFWLVEKSCTDCEIDIKVTKTENGFSLDYTDSGPGISDTLLESGVIFDPGFTTKPHGTGLGLSIAGEAATRNNLTLTALQCETGAHFILYTDK